MIWRAGTYSFDFPRSTLIMGILNVTPDSFSDGGLYDSTDRAVERGLEMVAEGADIIDIGGESTRPNAVPVSVDEELKRVIPVIEILARKVSVPISIDTTKVEVARAAIVAGASIINDVAGNRTDDTLWRLAGETGAGYILMHTQGTPQTMQKNPQYSDVCAEVNEFFGKQLVKMDACGLTREQVVLDVGIGFGKTVEHNIALLKGVQTFLKWDRPIMIGASRKSFIGALTGAGLSDRLAGSLVSACFVAGEGAGLVRVHDVAATRQALILNEYLHNKINSV